MAIFDIPNGPDDHDGILKYTKEIAGANRPFWLNVEAQAWKNILFYLGIQWVIWEPGVLFWRPMGLAKNVPRPVTNRLKPLVNDLTSKLVGFKPPITYGPGSEEEADVAAASVADRVNSSIEIEAQLRVWKPLVAKWLSLTGNGFGVSTYDASPDTGTMTVQSERCKLCQSVHTPLDITTAGNACPTCGQKSFPHPETGQPMAPFEPAIDGTGQPIQTTLPRGKHKFEVENVFTTRFDPQASRLEESAYVRIARTRDKPWVSRMYGEEFADECSYAVTRDPYTMLFDSLAYTTMGGGRTLSTTRAPDLRAMVERLWIKPDPVKCPNGIYAVIVGDKVAESMEWPYHEEDGRPMLNIVHYKFDDVPGRMLADTRANDVIPKQEQLNRVDSLIELHTVRMANAVWLVPDGVGVSRITGETGQVLRYNALAGVPPPQRVSGDQIPPYLLQWRESIKAEIEQVWGSSEISRGEAPFRGAAYATVQLLDERGQEAQSNTFYNWSLAWMEWSRQNINIFREYADEERISSLGTGRWAMQKFSKAKLQGKINLDVELGQNKPRSMVAKRAVAQQCITDGIINPFDPQQNYQLARFLGAEDLMPERKKDYEKAARVADALLMAPTPMALQQMIRPPLPWDNHAIQLSTLRQLEMDERFDTIEPWRQQAILQRAAIHFAFMRQEMMDRQAKGGSIAPSGGKPGAGGGAQSKGAEDGGDSGAEGGVVGGEAQGASPDTFSGAKGRAVGSLS